MRPNAVPLSRDDVAPWLEEYDGQLRPTKKLRKYLEGKVKEKGLQDVVVDTTDRTDIKPDEWRIVDFILADLESYVKPAE